MNSFCLCSRFSIFVWISLWSMHASIYHSDVKAGQQNSKLSETIVTRCSTPDAPLEKMLQLQKEFQRWLQAGNWPNNTVVTIPVAFHVIRYSSGGANVTDQQINDQIAILNSSYVNTNFRFSLHSIQRINNDSWVNAGLYTQAEINMKQSLAIDPLHVLNFYTNDLPGDGLGYARFPWEFTENSYMHGVVCDFGSMPSGTIPNFNEGDTGVHEIGHFVGLWHTFQNGCSVPGDEVNDTPFEEIVPFSVGNLSAMLL